MKCLSFLLIISLASCSQVLSPSSLALTIYNDNFAIVKDIRQIQFDQGESVLYFTDVSANIQTQTVTFKAVSDPSAVRVYQQNFQKNLVNTQGILQKYIDKNINVYVQLGSSAKKVSGKLLGYNSGYILQTQTGIQIFTKISGVEFPSLPQGFFTTPTLNWKVSSKSSQTSECEVAYRTTGFSWKADYSLTLNQNQTLADVGGWVTIDNNSGKKYVNAKLKLIAGDVNVVQSQPIMPMYYARATVMNSVAAPTFSQKSFADYHLYTLSQPVTLNESSQKQVEFVPKVYNIQIQKYHQISISAGGYGQSGLKAKNYVKFLNSKNNGLGIAFPKGTVRVFKQDTADNSLQFIGEDNIDHIPKDQNITISTGNAFDITSQKIVKSRTSNDNQGGYSAQNSMKVTNHKPVKADVIVVFSNGYGDNLRITVLGDTQAPTKVSTSEYRWRKTLEKDQVWTLNWKEDYFK